MKAEQIFKQYPKLDSFFETSDGAQFFNANDASAHARNLKNKKVNEVKRPEAKPEAAGAEKSEKAKTA